METTDKYQRIEIINLMGATIYSKAINSVSSTYAIDMSTYASGMYIIRFTSTEGVINSTIIKQ